MSQMAAIKIQNEYQIQIAEQQIERTHTLVLFPCFLQTHCTRNTVVKSSYAFNMFLFHRERCALFSLVFMKMTHLFACEVRITLGDASLGRCVGVTFRPNETVLVD